MGDVCRDAVTPYHMLLTTTNALQTVRRSVVTAVPYLRVVLYKALQRHSCCTCTCSIEKSTQLNRPNRGQLQSAHFCSTLHSSVSDAPDSEIADDTTKRAASVVSFILAQRTVKLWFDLGGLKPTYAGCTGGNSLRNA